jgi:hypothetical protein
MLAVCEGTSGVRKIRKSHFVILSESEESSALTKYTPAFLV